MIKRLLAGAALALALGGVAAAASPQAMTLCDPSGNNCAGLGARPNLATAQPSATTTSGPIVAARPGRATVTIENTGSVPVYIGPTGVPTTTGFLLPGVAGASVTIGFSGEIDAVTASSTAALTTYETF